VRHLIFTLICTILLSACQDSRPTLKIFTWASYFDPGIITEFEKEYNCRVILDLFDSNELMYAKLKSGQEAYDLLTPSLYTASTLHQHQLLQPLDYRSIPNLKFLDTRYCNLKDCEPFGVPYLLSFTGIGYLKDRVSLEDKSWSIFNNPHLKWRSTLLNDYRETLGAALLLQGADPNDCTQQQLELSVQQVKEWKQNIAKFENEQYKLGLDSAEFLIVHAYSGDIAQIMQENPNIDFFLPKEGFTYSADIFCICRDSKMQELAHQFINFMLRPDIAARNTAHTCYLCPNTASYELLPKSLRENSAIFIPEEDMQRAKPILNIGDKTASFLKAWEEAKSE
jgi:spermidine/putrescine transport system substrate-binding protein